MKTFAEYYKDLLEWEGIEFQELITNWKSDLIEQIKADFEQVVSSTLSD